MKMGKFESLKHKIEEQIKRIMQESSNYPPGAEHDPNAPWNDRSEDIEVSNYTYDTITGKFIVDLSNGNQFEIDGIDVLEIYWKKNPGSYAEQERMFGDNDLTSDINYINYLEAKNPGVFSDILYDIGERRDLFGID